MSWQYRTMIYFAVATLHFYRNDIFPPRAGGRYEEFMATNRTVLKRVGEEALNLFEYELSHEQVLLAVQAYLSPSQSVANTNPATLLDMPVGVAR